MISAITNLIIGIISNLGYAGVLMLMALQTIAIPIPSEIILPFAGHLAGLGRFNIFIIAIAGGLGSCIGSSVAYYIGYKGGRPLVEKYGKYILISKHDLNIADNFFIKYESLAIFFGQLLPVVRSFIAFPAGVAKADFKRFLIFVFSGSFIWSLVLAFFGMKLGENWDSLKDRFHNLDLVIVGLIVIGVGLWIYRHVSNRRG